LLKKFNQTCHGRLVLLLTVVRHVTGWARASLGVAAVGVAFKTLDISQVSVATHLTFGGIFSDSIITNFLLILTVK